MDEKRRAEKNDEKMKMKNKKKEEKKEYSLNQSRHWCNGNNTHLELEGNGVNGDDLLSGIILQHSGQEGLREEEATQPEHLQMLTCGVSYGLLTSGISCATSNYGVRCTNCLIK